VIHGITTVTDVIKLVWPSQLYHIEHLPLLTAPWASCLSSATAETCLCSWQVILCHRVFIQYVELLCYLFIKACSVVSVSVSRKNCLQLRTEVRLNHVTMNATNCFTLLILPMTLEPWSMTLTFSPRQAVIITCTRAKSRCQKSVGSKVSGNRWTWLTAVSSPLTQSMITHQLCQRVDSQW